jgi:hypothetical protein
MQLIPTSLRPSGLFWSVASFAPSSLGNGAVPVRPVLGLEEMQYAKVLIAKNQLNLPRSGAFQLSSYSIIP